MPIQSGSITFARYRVEHKEKAPSDARRWFHKALLTQAFEPIDKKGEDDRAVGFVELEDHNTTDFSAGRLYFGERALFCWRIDQLKIPASQVKAELEKWETAFKEQNDRKPGRKEKNEARAQIRHQLRNRATPVTKTHDLAWNLKTGQLQIWSSSRKVIEEIVGSMETAFEGVKLIPLIPGAMAIGSGLAEDALKPTANLLGVDLPEVNHGAA